MNGCTMAGMECTVHVRELLEFQNSFGQVVHKRNYSQRTAADIEAVLKRSDDHDPFVDSMGFPEAQHRTKVRVKPAVEADIEVEHAVGAI